jgi:hypothetical protein
MCDKKKGKFLECFSNRQERKKRERVNKEKRKEIKKESGRDLNDQLVHSVGLTVLLK